MRLMSIIAGAGARNTRSATMRAAASGADRLPVWAIALVFVFPASPAYAYIDPGSGSLLLQMILAGIAGAAFYFRGLIAGGLRKILRRDRSAKAAEEPETSQGPGPEG